MLKGINILAPVNISDITTVIRINGITVEIKYKEAFAIILLLLKNVIIADIATEKQANVNIVYKFQIAPEFSDLIAHAIRLIIKEHTVYTIQDTLNKFFFLLKNLILSVFIIIIIEFIKKSNKKIKATEPNFKRVCVSIEIATIRFKRKIRGAKIIQVKEIISLIRFFII